MNTLISSLADVCRCRLLAEKWLLAPSLRIGHQWLEALARQGQTAVNCHVKTLKSLAIDLAAPHMARHGVTLATSMASALLVDRACREAQGKLQYLSGLEPAATLSEALLASIDAVRIAGLSLSELDPRHFEVATKGIDLRLVYEAYARLLSENRLLDYADVLGLAIGRLSEDPGCLGRETIVLMSQDFELRGLESALWQAIPVEHKQVLATDVPIEEPACATSCATDLELLRWLLQPATAPPPHGDQSVSISRAVGEVNEVRNALRQCIANGIHWDAVELLHTDRGTYVPLIFETLSVLDLKGVTDEGDLPVTFAEGIPCRYARPGRALLAWIRWIRDGFPQGRLCEMLKDGLLAMPGVDQEQPGFSRLAALLRGAPIGAGRERYLPKLKDRITAVENKLTHLGSDFDIDDTRGPSHVSLERDLADLKVLLSLVSGLLAISPDPEAPITRVIDHAREFLENYARSISKLDRFAAQKLEQELRDTVHLLELGDEGSSFDPWRWLESLPLETSVLGSGPRPGCLHVDSLWQGGHTGRSHTFILGLDDSRFPGAGLQDPLLLDSERHQLSKELPTAATQLAEALPEFTRLLARLRGRVKLSFTSRSLADDREMFPSPMLIAVHRLLSANPAADQDDLLRSLPPPAAFAPRREDECLDLSEWWLWRLTEPERVQQLERLLDEQFPHLAYGREAASVRSSAEFTAFDGYVPQAGADLDPTSNNNRVLSASGIQTLATCPRRYFFQYGLDVRPPDELTVDPNQWLDALAFGSLLHELFEDFVGELVKQGKSPQYKRDIVRLRQLLAKKIEEYKVKYPPPSEHVLAQQKMRLDRTAETFLREEERHCAAHDCQPIYLEAALGMPAISPGTPLDTLEPISIPLSKGRAIRVRGRVDRIDRVGPAAAHTYVVWDYKTGSDWGYSESDPLQSGRKIQPYLYVTMVAHRLREFVSPNARVSHFGFFFPGVKAAGRRVQWTTDELKDGRRVLSELCQVLASGAFIATMDSKVCRFCDYQPICGDVDGLAGESQLKLEQPSNRILAPLVQLWSANENQA